MLDEMLQYHLTPPDDDFTERTLRLLRRRQRQRNLILWGSGAVGAAFGIAGVALLSSPLAQLFQSAGFLPVSLGIVALAGAGLWLFQDEIACTG